MEESEELEENEEKTPAIYQSVGEFTRYTREITSEPQILVYLDMIETLVVAVNTSKERGEFKVMMAAQKQIVEILKIVNELLDRIEKEAGNLGGGDGDGDNNSRSDGVSELVAAMGIEAQIRNPKAS